jgi:hypothetical protein
MAAVAATVTLAACSSPPQPGVLSMSTTGCGGTWHVSGPGWHTFQLRDSDTADGEVDLINPATGGVYAEIGGLGPQATAPMTLDVGSGRYAISPGSLDRMTTSAAAC